MSESSLQNRPYLQILFECCRVYQRVYKNKEGTRYEGRCPRCMRSVTFLVGPDGTSSRRFRVY